MQFRTYFCSFCFLIFLAIPPTICFANDALRPFQSDGCSRFPDRALIGHTDWCKCCVAHDLAYWRGGSSEERFKADHELKSCVLASTENEQLAEVMFTGVRLGGGPYFYTSYRWGYGWAYGHAYKPLTPEEENMVSVLEKEYRTANPNLSCPNPVFK